MRNCIASFRNTYKTEFYTHPLQDESSLKIVIKGFLIKTSESEVAGDLKELGYEMTRVRIFSNSIRKFSIYMVTLPLNLASKRIFQETSVLYMSVKIEAYKSNSPTQCFSCQRFGHSSLHCGYAPRYVKFTGIY